MVTFERPRSVASRSRRKLDELHESIGELEDLATKLERYTNPAWRDAQESTMYRKCLGELFDDLQYFTSRDASSSITNVWMLSDEDRNTLLSIANRAGSVVLYQTESQDMLTSLLDATHDGMYRVSYNREYAPDTLLERLRGWSVLGLDLDEVSQTKMVYLGGKQPQYMLARHGFTLEVHRSPDTVFYLLDDDSLVIEHVTIDLGYSYALRTQSVDRSQSLFTDVDRHVRLTISADESINRRSRHSFRSHELTIEYM